MKLQLSVLFLLCQLLIFGQTDYNELVKGFYDARKIEDTLACEAYAKKYLDKAKDEHNVHEMVYAYYLHSRKYISFQEKVNYLKEGITLATQHEDLKNLKFLYANASALYFNEGLMKKSLDYAIEAINIKDFNTYDVSILHNLGNIYERIEDVEKAIDCYEKVIKLEEKEGIQDTLGLVLTLHGLFNMKLEKNQIGELKFLRSRIKALCGNKRRKIFDLLSTALIDFKEQRYQEALVNFNKMIENKAYYLKLEEAKVPLVWSLVYRSKLHLRNNEKKLALKDLVEADKLSKAIHFIHPKMHTALLQIVALYEERGDTQNQIVYLNRLIQLDSVLTNGYKDINHSIVNRINIAQLLSEKESLERKNRYSIIFGFVLSICFLLLGLLFIRFRKRSKEKLKRKGQKQSELLAPKKVIERIEKQLVQFEEELVYLDPNLNLGSIAKSFGTNEKYLSQVIRQQFKKKFTQYMTDLRITYAVANIHRYHQYSIKSIALEFGFNSPNVFSKSFREKTGVNPSEFLKNLEINQD